MVSQMKGTTEENLCRAMSTLELPFLLFLARINNWYWRVPVSKCITLGTMPSQVALFGDCFVNLLECTVTIGFYFGADI